jgi:hypothetical protein
LYRAGTLAAQGTGFSLSCDAGAREATGLSARLYGLQNETFTMIKTELVAKWVELIAGSVRQ